MFRSIHLAYLFARRLRLPTCFYLEPSYEDRRRLLETASLQLRFIIKQPLRFGRERNYSSSKSPSRIIPSLFPFGMLHLRLYPIVVIARRRPQLRLPLPDTTRPLSGVIWDDLTEAPQLAATHIPATHTKPNGARQFRVEFNKSRAGGRFAGNQVRNYVQHHPLMRASVRCCIGKRQAPCLNTHWI